ncbi:MAG: hypothetical protein HOB70_10750 [Chloroflexi bacterium]|jgi:hypothetical protein|nr:hypothetical protein [Candidatus Neomarinimicrobiota bacterium]MBT4638406.1 hypothetical protein [Deltaproteobacteria bacterium]MBT4683502.1 hypothetical protein [Chloroflexota bacterium]MBT6358547.1 hypothetical protein [Chloroflexota bacterium]
MKQSNKTIILIFGLIFPVLIMSGEKVVIDLKVALVETADLAPAQAGAMVYLMKSDWASVSEFKEDVAVWMTDYERKKNFLGQQVVSLTLEVREPSSIRTGNLIKKQNITVRYRVSASDTARYNQDFLNELDDLSQELQIEAYFLGVKIESVLKGILK